ncbi:MAG TPA: ABC transporter ATP-binding protein [Puia sp.]|nr:ABC transporter ATP-binding protein [Puia sp.]
MKKVAKNIFSLLTHPEKRWFLWITASDIFINILDIIFLGALIVFINDYTRQPYSSVHPGVIGRLAANHFYPAVIAFFFCFSLKNLIGFFVIKKQNHFVYQVALRMSASSLSDYLSSDYSNYAHTDSSVHIRKISQQPIQFGQYVLLNFQQIISQSVLIIITIVVILVFNAKLFLLLTFVIIPPVALTAVLMKKKLQALRQHAKINGEKTIQYLYEALNGYVESNIYDKRIFFSGRFELFQKKLNNLLADQQAIQGFPSRLIEIFAIFGLCILIIISRQFGNAQIPVLLIGAFLGAAYKIIPGIVKILNSAGQMKAYHFTVTDLIENNYIPLDIDPHNPEKISSIAFENIYFSHDKKNVLNDINFTIGQGDFIGICGVSGKGKTTIINLLLGFLQPREGVIKINNRVTEKKTRLSFIKNISYAKQQPFFIHDTLLKNILFDTGGDDPEKLNEIISITGIKKIMDDHKAGLEYIIEENGKNISGGERQRIVFARTLYKQAHCVILDEPFTELDEASEMIMVSHLRHLAREGKMIILITHNKNSLVYCNKIIALD